MTKILNGYEDFCIKTDKTYRCLHSTCEYHYVTGLAAEVGEVAALYQKAIRSEEILYVVVDGSELMSELGDVLWYLTRLANQNGISLERVIQYNMQKLTRRNGEE